MRRLLAATIDACLMLTIVAVLFSHPVFADDLEKMQGYWKGKTDGGAALTLEVNGKQIKSIATGAGGSFVTQYQITLDETTDPKSIDYGSLKSPSLDEIKKSDPTTKVADDIPRGIYKFEGDKLVICLGLLGNRPTRFGAGKGGGMLVAYSRAEPPKPVEKKPTKTPPERYFMGLEFKGAIIRVVKRNLNKDLEVTTIELSNGELVDVSMNIGFGYDLNGERLPKEEVWRMLKVGNVVDGKIRRYVNFNYLFFDTLHLKEGELEAPPQKKEKKTEPKPERVVTKSEAEKPTSVEYRGATITKVHNQNKVDLSVEGKPDVTVMVTRSTKAFDANGRQLSMIHQSWVLIEGNKVDATVEVFAHPRKGVIPEIQEIHLREGKLKDNPRYVDNPK